MVRVPVKLLAQLNDGEAGYIGAHWIYNSEDPLAVGLALPPDTEKESEEENTWLFGRSLLAEALNHPKKSFGLDVKVLVAGRSTIIRLDNGECVFRVVTSTKNIKEFLKKTYREFPIEQEQPVIDESLNSFLAKVKR
jgi:Streptomyces sporulation and cell division protein, SsgA.